MKHLPPAYFALVTAIGIVSISAWDFQFRVLAAGLFAFNLAAYAVLAGLTVLRAIGYSRLFFADMTDHRFGPGFFTAVAGSGILGTQILLMTHGLPDRGRSPARTCRRRRPPQLQPMRNLAAG